ncbi:collagen-like protein [Parapedobacter tibetensis]|uniref:collagen-like protein n=1 Tax=Parapedobacter tibetensis TaxID=2972951 RepID=UPI00214DB78B|nr:collagen-like protein [Parapedobacter tibetensis]
MKKIITQILGAAFCILMLVQLTSCEKEGPMGPAGPIGEAGPQGDQGEKGDKGDVGNFAPKVFEFENVTIAPGIGTNRLFDFDVTKEEFEQSMTILYLAIGTNNSNWLVMPGVGSGGQHAYRLWYAFLNEGANSRAILQRVAGPEDQSQTYTVARIVVIPLNMATAMQAKGIDMGNFDAVSASLRTHE